MKLIVMFLCIENSFHVSRHDFFYEQPQSLLQKCQLKFEIMYLFQNFLIIRFILSHTLSECSKNILSWNFSATIQKQQETSSSKSSSQTSSTKASITKTSLDENSHENFWICFNNFSSETPPEKSLPQAKTFHNILLNSRRN